MGKTRDGSVRFDSCFPLAELSPDTFDAGGDQSKQAPDKWLKWLEKTQGNKGWSTRHEPLDFKMSTPANRRPTESNVNGRLVHSRWQRLVCTHFFAVCHRVRVRGGGGEKKLFSLKFVRQIFKMGANHSYSKWPKCCFSEVQSYQGFTVFIHAAHSSSGFLYLMQKQLFFFAWNENVARVEKYSTVPKLKWGCYFPFVFCSIWCSNTEQVNNMQILAQWSCLEVPCQGAT